VITLTMKVIDGLGRVLAEQSGEGQVSMVYTREYSQGDRIQLSASGYNIPVIWQVDDALGAAYCFVTKEVQYMVPFGEKRSVYSPKVFSGGKHYLYARIANESEVRWYRNLAENVADQHDVEGCYPHASANVETRGEAVFAARNAIDGISENHGHGEWPYTSWGINRDPNAEMKVEFGRVVMADRVGIILRADFPHDAYWTQGTIAFSDGSEEILEFRKTDELQLFKITPRETEWIKIGTLIKADDPSPFPALTQIQVYGWET